MFERLCIYLSVRIVIFYRYMRTETDSLVHTPRLGLQRRQVQCRKKDGQFVEAM